MMHGCKIRLPSGPELTLEIVHHDPQNDTWMAAITLSATFRAADIEFAEEAAFPAMVAVLEKALGDLRDADDDLKFRIENPEILK